MSIKRELLFSVTKKDLRIDYYSGTGAGGQYRNKHQNCVRITHSESGVVVTGQSNRDRQSNIREAFKNLASNQEFKLWLNRKADEVIQGKTLEELVAEMMLPENLKVEALVNGTWELLK
ncbi:MAG: hypothetical protein EHM49_00245 [Deltaproteobacteria bacterium]|nr:MAG: hypothetical protein EHM49_00245 [Deltaproteobacteria bacterium]